MSVMAGAMKHTACVTVLLCCCCAAQAMDITRRHESWISQYVTLAEELRSLIAQTSAAYSTTEFGNSTANIKVSSLQLLSPACPRVDGRVPCGAGSQAALDAFYEYKRDTKPQYQAILASLQGLFATITASSKSNNRPAYVPPEPLTLAALAEEWKTLEAAEDAYEHGVRREHALFSTLDNLLGRFAVKLQKVTAWMTSRAELFGAGKYGNSRTEVETLLEAHTAFEQQAQQYNAAIDQLEVWANTPGMEKHEEQANCLAHVLNARNTMTELMAAAAAYQATLYLMKEKYEQLQVCQKFSVWLEQQAAVFAAQNYGDSLVAAEDLIKAFEKDYVAELSVWKNVRCGFSWACVCG